MTRHIEFVDQTLRDGPQSLWSKGMKLYDAVEAMPILARAGYRTIDLWGAVGHMTKVREGVNPWEQIDYMVAALKGNEVRGALRTISVSSFIPTPQVIIDLWIKTIVKHGMRSIWLYDCLFDLPHMKHAAKVVVEAGGVAVPSVMYGLTSVHDDEFFARKTREMASWDDIHTIYVEDAPGVLTPERATTLLPALREAAGAIPLEAHFHNTTNLATHNYIIAMENGFDIIHTASRPIANGPSMPSTEAMVNIVEHMGYSHSLDKSTFGPVAEIIHRQAVKGGHRLGVPAEFDPRIYDHQLPGGMTGSLTRQLEAQGLGHRFDEVLEAIPQVRRDLGEPIMATPFSQIVGVQAVMNLITGDPYTVVPDEVIHYVLGHYGPVPGPINPEALDRILSTPHAKDLMSWVRPDPSLKEIRSMYPKSISDEELLLRYNTSDEDVDRLRFAPPLRTDPRRSTNEIVNHVADLIEEKQKATSFSVTTKDFSFHLAKA